MTTQLDAAADPLVALRDLEFGWRRAETILEIPTFQVGRGEKVFLKGPSGSGKSTLLGVICGVLRARGGAVDVFGHNFARASGAQRDTVRADHMGVIFQMFNLLPYLSLLANVTLPCLFSPARRRRAVERGGGVEAEARRLLSRLKLDAEVDLRAAAHELSVGQQQRVAAARALIGAPGLIVADEPTSSLDADTRDAFLKLLIEEADAHGASLLFVSHDASLASRFDRAVDLAGINQVKPARRRPAAGAAA